MWSAWTVHVLQGSAAYGALGEDHRNRRLLLRQGLARFGAGFYRGTPAPMDGQGIRPDPGEPPAVFPPGEHARRQEPAWRAKIFSKGVETAHAMSFYRTLAPCQR